MRWLVDGKVDFDGGVLTGYLAMIAAFITIVVAVWQYKSKHSGGAISFGSAFKMGLFITLICSLIYMVAWEVYMHYFIPDWVDQYIAYIRNSLEESGLTNTQVEGQIASQSSMMEAYASKPLMRLGMTFLEIFPVGLLITLINAFVQSRFFVKSK